MLSSFTIIMGSIANLKGKNHVSRTPGSITRILAPFKKHHRFNVVLSSGTGTYCQHSYCPVESSYKCVHFYTIVFVGTLSSLPSSKKFLLLLNNYFIPVFIVRHFKQTLGVWETDGWDEGKKRANIEHGTETVFVLRLIMHSGNIENDRFEKKY